MATAQIDRPAAALREFTTRGYAVVRGLFTADDVDVMNDHFAEIHRTGANGRYTHMSMEEAGNDPLLAYPRIMNPHRYSSIARDYLRDPRAAEVLRALFGEEPLGVQSMLYFKPPGARGQAMHQDQFYLQVRPGTCIAAWTALDRVDRANGGMIMVPLTHELAIDCRKAGKEGAGSYGPNAIPVPVPEGYRGEAPELDPGDTIFFNGSLLHGSGRNVTTDRWRRSFICHYVGVGCETISEAYHPLVDMSGQDVVRAKTTDGGPCGGWVGAAH
ncbi:MAG: phytanoyl-CoA dioxygenase family protein [Spirochaetaceae bacterium]|nr:MAG: phytanoyl-CoA dioxygenase family protein [Spirochaetaceae bacterium]